MSMVIIQWKVGHGMERVLQRMSMWQQTTAFNPVSVPCEQSGGPHIIHSTQALHKKVLLQEAQLYDVVECGEELDWLNSVTNLPLVDLGYTTLQEQHDALKVIDGIHKSIFIVTSLHVFITGCPQLLGLLVYQT